MPRSTPRVRRRTTGPKEVGRVERGLRFAGAVVVASLAAGPALWLNMVLAGLFSGEALDWQQVWVPIVTALGAWFPMARSFLAWIGAGALGGLLFAIIFFADLIEEGQLVSALILNGMACAAICRAFTRWPDYDSGPTATLRRRGRSPRRPEPPPRAAESDGNARDRARSRAGPRASPWRARPSAPRPRPLQSSRAARHRCAP